MKTRFKIFSCLSLLAILLTGCNSSGGRGSDNPPVIEDTYTITWKNWDGSVLEVDENVAYGSTPTYDGSTPTKPGDSQYSYTWTGWTPSVVAASGDATYTATFSSSVNSYTITWKNWDGSVLEIDENVTYGSTPSYDGTTPTKPN